MELTITPINIALKITSLNTILCPFDYEILSFQEQIHGSYKQIFTECLLVLGPARILLHPMQVKPWPNASIIYFPEGGHTIPQIKQKAIIQVQKDAPNRE